MVGSTISHYKVLEELGRGGMGVVYKAQDTRLNRDVALKFLAEHLTSDSTARERFVREARSAAAVEHDAICAIYDIGETDDGQTYIVMPYYRGDTLKTLIAKGSLTHEIALEIAFQVSEGLAATHDEGIIHRDLKPGNILVTKHGNVKILDFGLAKLAGSVDLTRSGGTIGTIGYMSPEQVREEEVNGATDIWSLGIILYEMLTGARPFQGEYEAAVTYAILNNTEKPLDDPEFDIDREVSVVVAQMLKKRINDRFGSASELAKALSSIRQRHQTHVRKVPAHTSLAQVKSVISRRRWFLGTVVLMVVVLAYVGPLPFDRRMLR